MHLNQVVSFLRRDCTLYGTLGTASIPLTVVIVVVIVIVAIVIKVIIVVVIVVITPPPPPPPQPPPFPSTAIKWVSQTRVLWHYIKLIFLPYLNSLNCSIS